MPDLARAVLVFGGLLASPLVAYRLHTLRSTELRALALTALQVCVAAVPWGLSPDWTFVRFCAAVSAVLCFIRIWETRNRVLPEPATWSQARYLAYFLCIPDIVFSETALERRQARLAGLRRLGRALGKLMGLVGLFIFREYFPELSTREPVGVLWNLWGAYWASSAVVDVGGGTSMLLSGHGAREAFHWPPLATSPRDFWSRRWNSMFRNASHRLVFTPLGGAHRPLPAVVAVFAWSALVHEYLVIAALGSTRGHMTAFFALHGAATMVSGLWQRRPWPLPRWLAVTLHLAWLVATAPLFFAPLESIVGVQDVLAWFD